MKEFLLTFHKDVYIIVIYIVLLLAIAIIKFRKNKDNNNIFTCENLFIMFFYVFIAIGPIVSMATDKYKYNYNIFFIFGFSLVLFLLGADIIIGNKKIKITRKKVNDENKKIKKIDWKNIQRNAKIILYIAYIFAVIYLLKNLSFILQDIENNRVSAMSGNGVIIYFSYAMIPATWILYYCHLNYNKVKYMWIYFIIDIILLLLFGYRSRIIEIILMCIIIRDDYSRIKIKTLLRIGVCLIIIVSLLQAVRGILSSAEMNIFNSIKNTMCVASINLIYIFNAFPTKVNYQYGYTYFINFQQLLPSSSLDMTMWLKKTLNMNFDGGRCYSNSYRRVLYKFWIYWCSTWYVINWYAK